MESAGRKSRPCRSFTSEFKAEIVELCQRGDRSIGQVARDFDLTETAVREWVRQAERDAGARDDGGLTHRARGRRPEQAGQARFEVESGMAQWGAERKARRGWAWVRELPEAGRQRQRDGDELPHLRGGHRARGGQGADDGVEGRRGAPDLPAVVGSPQVDDAV
jgi:transposase-like protein